MLAVAATGWAEVGLEAGVPPAGVPPAGVPPAHPAVGAATVMARAAAVPRRAFVANLMFL